MSGRRVGAGVVNFLKPAGMSSHDAVAFFRRISGVRRVGHAGTLDPMAAGVLPLCVGKATRIVEYLALDRKRYRCEMRLGVVTDTQDVWGRTLSKADDGFAARLGERRVEEVAARFVGELMQTPPAYSAVKINGRKLYEYARAGEAVSAPARRIEIISLDIRRVDLARGVVSFDAECSKGTYMRALCHDMGRELGCGAAMSGLVRTRSGIFDIDGAHTAEALEAAFSSAAPLNGVLTAPDAPLGAFGALKLSAEASRAFINGAPVVGAAGPSAPPGLRRVYGGAEGPDGVFLGVGRLRAGVLSADKVFYEA
jgi:tRNA pseudouridine55 synthase